MSLFPRPTVDTEFASKVDETIALLDGIIADRGVLVQLPVEQRKRLLTAAGLVSKPDAVARTRFNRVRRRREKQTRVATDQARLEQTGIRKKRADTVFKTPNLAPPRELIAAEQAATARNETPTHVTEERHCYVCKIRFNELHHFYDQMCRECGELNYEKRYQTADLQGRTAIVTGARVKIGYQAAILLLRAGARVVATTRFPRDAAARYACEDDFGEWKDRLEIFGLDLRHTPSVEMFTEHLLSHLDGLDFILNNACQTVRRPPGFYEHLMAIEQDSLGVLPEAWKPMLSSYEALRAEGSTALLRPGQPTTADRIVQAHGITRPSELAQVALLPEDVGGDTPALFPEGRLDPDLQQIDLRDKNSWRLKLDEVSTVELLEVHLVNAVAPFVLNGRLKPLMTRTPTRDKHIVNVSAMEGQFYRLFKTDKHPHTNMAKAALNMMTRTSATDYIHDGIHMNAVDTGWVTDEDPAAIAARKEVEQRFTPPLDIVDGAARIVDPIFDGFNTGEHVWGQFLKDYKPTDW